MPAAAHGLGGHSELHLQVVWLLVSLLFLAFCVALILAHRRLQRQAELEEIDRLLAEEEAASTEPSRRPAE